VISGLPTIDAAGTLAGESPSPAARHQRGTLRAFALGDVESLGAAAGIRGTTMSADAERVSVLEDQVAVLQREVAELKQEMAQFRKAVRIIAKTGKCQNW